MRQRLESLASLSPAQRGLEGLFAIFLLVLLSPLFLVISLALFCINDGKILFRQERIGEGGKHFSLYKFMTFRPEFCDLEGQMEPDAINTSAFGRKLRRFGLDELPQLLNITRGEMAFVGPRPYPRWLLDELEEIHPGFSAIRQTVRPGVTGYWQVRRGDRGGGTDLEERIVFDLAYIHKRSWRLDLWVIFLTPLAVLEGRGLK